MRSRGAVSGSSDVICEPMCTCTPTGRSPAVAPASRNSAARRSIGTPNLLVLSPVEMCGWLRASMSGLTRSATRAVVPRARAMAAMRVELARRLDVDRLAGRATIGALELGRVLPTPVNTICDGSNPARSATSISPIEFASAPLPSSRSSRTIASVELAFSA